MTRDRDHEVWYRRLCIVGLGGIASSRAFLISKSLHYLLLVSCRTHRYYNIYVESRGVPLLQYVYDYGLRLFPLSVPPVTTTIFYFLHILRDRSHILRVFVHDFGYQWTRITFARNLRHHNSPSTRVRTRELCRLHTPSARSWPAAHLPSLSGVYQTHLHR